MMSPSIRSVIFGATVILHALGFREWNEQNGHFTRQIKNGHALNSFNKTRFYHNNFQLRASLIKLKLTLS